MTHFGSAEQGGSISKLRFHPRRPLLASLAVSRAEVCIWRWDDSGAMECLARISRETAASPGDDVRNPLSELLASQRKPDVDVVWHPQEDLLALVGGGRAVEFWSQDQLVKTLGKPPQSGRAKEFRFPAYGPGGDYDLHTRTVDIPLSAQGYRAVAFSAAGDRLVASRFGEASFDWDPTEVYDVDTGALIGSFWGTDTTLALHPEGEILATLSSNQGASAIRFVRFADALRAYDVQINAFADGYARLLFNTTGDALAIVGHAYAFGVKVYRFPECRLVLEADLESWDDIRKTFRARHRRNEPDHGASDTADPLDEFACEVPDITDRIAFSPRGRHLLIGSTRGDVVAVNWKTGKPVRVWPAHEGPVVALDASPSLPVMATADADGHIKLWRWKEVPVLPDRAAKPITAAFLQAYRSIDPMTPEDGFRTTDGKRWYNLESMGEEELDEDAPPWAQIAKLTSLWGLDAETLSQRAETDPFARRIQSLKDRHAQDHTPDEPTTEGEVPAAD